MLAGSPQTSGWFSTSRGGRQGAEPPLHSYRQLPLAHVERTASALGSGVSPFDIAEDWEREHDKARLSASSHSVWRQYCRMCDAYGRAALPLTVTSLIAYMLFYVCVRRNSSANLNSVMSTLSTYARAHGFAWPDFSSHGSGATMTARISKVQRDWPAEVRGAPALTLKLGLARAISYLRSFGPDDLWALQWLAILSLMHSMLLRPSEVIPLDKFPIARGTRSGFAYPRFGDFMFTDVGMLYRTALSKTMKDRVDYRTCTAAALDLEGAVVNAPRAMRAYIRAAGLERAPANTPVFYYRARDGSHTTRLSRGMLLRELRSMILSPAGVVGWQHFTLRSFRPGGVTDMAAAGVPEPVIRKLGKWSAEAGIQPYNRVDHFILQDLAAFGPAFLSLQ
jgi:integrase